MIDVLHNRIRYITSFSLSYYFIEDKKRGELGQTGEHRTSTISVVLVHIICSEYNGDTFQIMIETH